MSLSFLKSQLPLTKNPSFPSYSQVWRKEGALSKSSLISPRINHLSRASTQESITKKASIFKSAGQNSDSLKVQVFLDNHDSGGILQRVSKLNHDSILPINDLQVSHNHATFTTIPIKMSLVDLIKRCREEEEYIPKEILLRYCSELTNGSQYLNEIFPDLGYLDPRGILIDQNDQIKIACFGNFKFVYVKSEPSLRFEFSQVGSVLASISKRDPRCQGWNLGAIIAGLCTLKPRLMSNIKLYGENRKKVIKEKLKNIHALYGKDFLKLIFHLFDPDISKSDAMNQLKDALSLVSLSEKFYSRSINPKIETEEQKIVEVSDSSSDSSQSLEESIIIVSAQNSEKSQNESEIQGQGPILSFSEVRIVPLETSVFEEGPQEPQILPLCESILNYKPLDRFGFPAWKFNISSIPIEQESILGYVPQNLLENSPEQQENNETQNEDVKEIMSIESLILNSVETQCNAYSSERINNMVAEERKKEIVREEIKEEVKRHEMKEVFSSLKEGELTFSNEASVIAIESMEDLYEENLDMKGLLQLVGHEEDFTGNNLINLVYEVLMEKRPNLSRISRVQIRDVLKTVLKMIGNEQISLYELLNNPLLNSQAILAGGFENPMEECKESLATYQLLDKGFNPSPVQSPSESDGERSQNKDEDIFLSNFLIGKEESNKKPLPSRLCRSFGNEKEEGGEDI